MHTGISIKIGFVSENNTFPPNSPKMTASKHSYFHTYARLSLHHCTIPHSPR